LGWRTTFNLFATVKRIVTAEARSVHSPSREPIPAPSPGG